MVRLLHIYCEHGIHLIVTGILESNIYYDNLRSRHLVLLYYSQHSASSNLHITLYKCFPSTKEYLSHASIMILLFFQILAFFIADENTMLLYMIFILYTYVSFFLLDNLYGLYIICTMK